MTDLVSQFFVPGKFPTSNEIRYMLGRRHGYRQYNSLKKAWEERVSLCCKAAKIAPYTAAHIRFVWFEENRKRDPSNVLEAGQKFCLDALQLAGVLKNDGWKQILSLSHRWRLEPGNPGVLITIIGQ